MNITELRQEATKIANQARAILDENENLSAEQNAQFDKMLADRDAYTARADRMAQIEERASRGEEIATQIAEQTGEVRSEERVDAFAEFLRGNIDQRELRANGIAVDESGGFTTPESWATSIITAAKSYGPMLNGDLVNLLLTPTGNTINHPKNDDTSNKGALIAENTQVSEQDLVFANVDLGAFKYTSRMVRVSNELMKDSDANMQAYVSDRLGERLGRIANEHATVGTGVNQPEGILTGASLGKTAASATALTADELIDLFYSIDPAYRANFAYMMNDATIGGTRKLKNGDGQYMWQPSLTAGAPELFNGRPIVANNDMPLIGAGNKSVVAGDFKKFTVRMVQGLGIKRLDERYADYDQTAFVGFWRLDSAVLDSAAIKYLIQAA